MREFIALAFMAVAAITFTACGSSSPDDAANGPTTAAEPKLSPYEAAYADLAAKYPRSVDANDKGLAAQYYRVSKWVCGQLDAGENVRVISLDLSFDSSGLFGGVDGVEVPKHKGTLLSKDLMILATDGVCTEYKDLPLQ